MFQFRAALRVRLRAQDDQLQPGIAGGHHHRGRRAGKTRLFRRGRPGGKKDLPDNDVRRFIHTINSAFTELENLNLPALAAINGFAFGGGLELALACDLRVASSGAVMGLTETSLAVTRGWGLANVLAAMQAGIDIFEGCYGGIESQPANFVDGVPVAGTGKYYYQDPSWVGLATLEDMVVMMDEMGIELGLDVDKVLDIGRMVERIVGRPLRSESIRQGRVLKGPRKDFSR
ncbi:MAG: enoyl-CoA hydratase-related protein [Proteobacteria bacterium]|nr:enoyl-CoA hydratase-related protein [Pseudomonadota bacterium]